MKKSLRQIVMVLTIAAGVLAATVLAHHPVGTSATTPVQLPSLQSTLAIDVGTLADKFVGLSRAMADKYDWRPGQGVRSVGEVFELIVNENGMLAGLLSGTPTEGGMRGGGRGAQSTITDPADIQEALRTSYATLRQAALEQIGDGRRVALDRTSVSWDFSGLANGGDSDEAIRCFGSAVDRHARAAFRLACARSGRCVSPKPNPATGSRRERTSQAARRLFNSVSSRG